MQAQLLAMLQSALAIAGERVPVLHQMFKSFVLFQSAPSRSATTRWRTFQSAPAIAGERVAARSESLRVSIRFQSAPAIAGERVPAPTPTPKPMFQSAPAIAGERVAPALEQRHHVPGFNPRPPLLASVWQARHLRGPVRHVSIRARHCWRACVFTTIGRIVSLWFQSAPAIAGERVVSTAALSCLACWVSIRARHCWRACGGSPWTTRRAGVGFNPRPPLLASVCGAGHLHSGPWRRFNPRPPLLASVWVTDTAYLAVFCVSIRARHCWRACAR